MTEYKPLDFHRMTIEELDDSYRCMMDDLKDLNSYDKMGELQIRMSQVNITLDKILKRGVEYPVTTDAIYDDVIERDDYD